jgi:hypothetical protein
MPGPDRIANTQAAIAWCLGRQQWLLVLQTHNTICIP